MAVLHVVQERCLFCTAQPTYGNRNKTYPGDGLVQQEGLDDPSDGCPSTTLEDTLCASCVVQRVGPGPSLVDAVEILLAKAEGFTFDVWQLSEVTKGGCQRASLG